MSEAEVIEFKEHIPEEQRKRDLRDGWGLMELANADWIETPEGLLGGRLLVKGSVAVLAGPAGVGKTWLALKLADAMAGGDKFAGLDTIQSRTLFVSEEMTAGEMRERIVNFRYNPKYGVRFRFQQGLDIARYDGMDRLHRLMETEAKPDLLIIDAFRDIHSGPESNNDFIAPMMKGLRDKIARRTGCAILLIHHFGKPTDFNSGINAVRGAKAITDVASDVLLVQNTVDARTITFEKTRHMKQPSPVKWELHKRADDKLDILFFSQDGDELQ